MTGHWTMAAERKFFFMLVSPIEWAKVPQPRKHRLNRNKIEYDEASTKINGNTDEKKLWLSVVKTAQNVTLSSLVVMYSVLFF